MNKLADVKQKHKPSWMFALHTSAQRLNKFIALPANPQIARWKYFAIHISAHQQQAERTQIKNRNSTSQHARWWISTKRCFVPPPWTFPMKDPRSNAFEYSALAQHEYACKFVQDGLQMSYNLSGETCVFILKWMKRRMHFSIKTGFNPFSLLLEPNQKPWRVMNATFGIIRFKYYWSGISILRPCAAILPKMAWFINLI